MLSSSELSMLQRHAEHALIDTCDIYRRVRVDDGAGGYTYTDSVVGDNVICRLTPVRNDFEQERLIAATLGSDISWILSLPVGTNITLNDYVVMDGHRLEVNAIMAEPRSILTVMRVVVSEAK